MASGLGKVRPASARRITGLNKTKRVRFRLYTGIAFFLGGLLLVISNFFTKG